MSEGSIQQKETPFVHKVRALARSFSAEPMNSNIDILRVKHVLDVAIEYLDQVNAPEDHESVHMFGFDTVNDVFDGFKDSQRPEIYITMGVSEAILSKHEVLKGFSELDMRYLMDKALQHEISYWEQQEWTIDTINFWYPDPGTHFIAHPAEMPINRLRVLKRYQLQLRELVVPTKTPERK